MGYLQLYMLGPICAKSDAFTKVGDVCASGSLSMELTYEILGIRPLLIDN